MIITSVSAGVQNSAYRLAYQPIFSGYSLVGNVVLRYSFLYRKDD